MPDEKTKTPPAAQPAAAPPTEEEPVKTLTVEVIGDISVDGHLKGEKFEMRADYVQMFVDQKLVKEAK
jgi:hypothetical protein